MSTDQSASPLEPLASGELMPRDVPVFNCIIYISRQSSGVHGRVANLDGVTQDGSTERDVLTGIVRQFKAKTAQYVSDGVEIPWIDPVPEPTEHEQARFVPVHL